MYVPPSLFILAASKLLPIVLRKTKWYGKSYLHRRAINAYKKGNLCDAVKYNLNSQSKDAEYEKALILKDVLLMHIDAEEMRLTDQTNDEEQRYNKVKHALFKINTNLAKSYAAKGKSDAGNASFLAIIGAFGLIISLNTSSLQDLLIYLMLVLFVSMLSAVIRNTKCGVKKVELNDLQKIWQQRQKVKEELEVITERTTKLLQQRSYLSQLRQNLSGGCI